MVDILVLHLDQIPVLLFKIDHTRIPFLVLQFVVIEYYIINRIVDFLFVGRWLAVELTIVLEQSCFVDIKDRLTFILLAEIDHHSYQIEII